MQRKCHHPLVLSYGANQLYPKLNSRQYSSGHSKKSSGSGGALLAVGALVLTGGATLAYAKYDQDFKKTLLQYIPFLEPVLKDERQKEASGNIVSQYYKSAKNSIFNLITGTQSTDTIKSTSGDLTEKPLKLQEYKGKV